MGGRTYLEPHALMQHPHDDETMLVGRGELAVIFVPVHHHDGAVMPFQSLVHRQVAGRAFVLGVLSGEAGRAGGANGAVSLLRQLVRCPRSGTSSWEWCAPPLDHDLERRWRRCVATLTTNSRRSLASLLAQSSCRDLLPSHLLLPRCGPSSRGGGARWADSGCSLTLALGVADSNLSTLSSPPSPPHAIHPCVRHGAAPHTHG